MYSTIKTQHQEIGRRLCDSTYFICLGRHNKPYPASFVHRAMYIIDRFKEIASTKPRSNSDHQIQKTLRHKKYQPLTLLWIVTNAAPINVHQNTLTSSHAMYQHQPNTLNINMMYQHQQNTIKYGPQIPHTSCRFLKTQPRLWRQRC
jgi:hypothetical protein